MGLLFDQKITKSITQHCSTNTTIVGFFKYKKQGERWQTSSHEKDGGWDQFWGFRSLLQGLRSHSKKQHSREYDYRECYSRVEFINVFGKYLVLVASENIIKFGLI